MATNEHSGFPLKWFKDQDSARNCFECAVCLEVLKDAVQVSECGHQFCELCIDDILKTDSRCPTCRIAISSPVIFKDQAANRLIRKLEVSCCNQGCLWAGSLGSYVDDHVNTCPLSIHNARSCSNNEVIKNLDERFESLKLEFSLIKEKHENDIKELKSQCESDIKKLTSQHENDIKEFKSQHENDLTTLTSEHKKDLTALRSEYDENMRELKQEITLLRSMSNGSGTFILKIPDFTRKLAHYPRTIYSTPFYSSPYGYKMMLQVNVDEAFCGYSGYMGVYVILMKGDYDGTLTWPFAHAITLGVVDQQDVKRLRRDHQVVLVPRGQQAFQRPRTDRNVNLGFRQFILHSTLSSRCYTKDDIVFIRVHVDTTSKVFS